MLAGVNIKSMKHVLNLISLLGMMIIIDLVCACCALVDKLL
jgi:hypothetical protein